MLISRLVPPTSVTEPTPRTFSSRFFSTWSAQLVSSTAVMAWPAVASGSTASDQIGAAGRVEAQHARLLDLVAQGRADRRHLLAHVLGRLAPVDVQLELDDDDRLALVAARGQRVDAGDRVDAFLDLLGDLALDDLGRGAGVVGRAPPPPGSRCWGTGRPSGAGSENRPSTTKASMTMVAKTGFFRLTRVNHMSGARGRLASARARRERLGCGRCAAGEPHRRAFAQRPDAAGDHHGARRDALHRRP